MSLFGIGISFKGCLFASVRRQCVVLHKLVSAYENRTKSILAEEAQCCDGRCDRGNCELQLAVCLVHAVFFVLFLKTDFTSFISLPVTSH